MLLDACAISAAPPTTLNAIAQEIEELMAIPMIDRGHHHHPGGLESALALDAAERIGDEAAERAADADRGEEQPQAGRPGGELVLGIDRVERPEHRDQEEERQRADHEKNAGARVR